MIKCKACCLTLEALLDLYPAHLHVSHMEWPTLLWTNQPLSSPCTCYSLSLECPLLCLPNKLLLVFKFLAQKLFSLRNHPLFLWGSLATLSTYTLPYFLHWIFIIICISFSSQSAIKKNILFIYLHHLAFNKFYLHEWIIVLTFT